MPSVACGIYLIDILFEIGPIKPAGMGGATAISDLDLQAWQANQSITLTPWEARTIRRLSREYAAMLVDASDANCPAPYVSPEIFNEQRRKQIANAMSSWADKVNASKRAP